MRVPSFSTLRPSTAAVRVGLLSIATFIAVLSSAAEAARSPTPTEGGGVRQAIFDHFAKRPGEPVITRITVAVQHGARNQSRYGKFARADLLDRRAGRATVLLGYFKSEKR